MLGHYNPSFTLATYTRSPKNEKTNSQVILANKILHATDEEAQERGKEGTEFLKIF